MYRTEQTGYRWCYFWILDSVSLKPTNIIIFCNLLKCSECCSVNWPKNHETKQQLFIRNLFCQPCFNFCAEEYWLGVRPKKSQNFLIQADLIKQTNILSFNMLCIYSARIKHTVKYLNHLKNISGLHNNSRSHMTDIDKTKEPAGPTGDHGGGKAPPPQSR